MFLLTHEIHNINGKHQIHNINEKFGYAIGPQVGHAPL